MGGFGKQEEDAFALLLVKLQKALGDTKVASACVGDTKNGVVSPKGVQTARAGGARLVDMALYSSNDLHWREEMTQAGLHIKPKHLTVGLSAAATSWKVAPTAVEVALRFSAMRTWDVDAIAVFGLAWIESYADALRAFISSS